MLPILNSTVTETGDVPAASPFTVKLFVECDTDTIAGFVLDTPATITPDTVIVFVPPLVTDIFLSVGHVIPPASEYEKLVEKPSPEITILPPPPSETVTSKVHV